MNKSLFLVISGMFEVFSVNAIASDQLVLASWGGPYSKSQEEAMIKPYLKESGTKVVMDDYSGGMAELRAQVESGSRKWDVIDMASEDVMRACDEGLLEKLDLESLPSGDDGTPASEDFIKNSLSSCAVGNIIWSTVLAYNSSVYGVDYPKTIADFFDVKRFPGKRGMFKRPQVNLEWALVADGVPADQVYDILSTEEGLERAFKKLDSIKSDVVWMTTGAQAPQLLASGEVAFTIGYNARIQDAIDNERQPFKIIWDHQVIEMNMFAIPKGNPKKGLAEDFIRFATASKQLGNQTHWIAYGPVRQSSNRYIKSENESKLPTSGENVKTAMMVNYDWWADNADVLADRFNVWLNN